MRLREAAARAAEQERSLLTVELRAAHGGCAAQRAEEDQRTRRKGTQETAGAWAGRDVAWADQRSPFA